MRASILVLGPLLAKYGKAKVSLPGGCAIGVRPIDLHLKAFAKMGADIELSHGYVMATANKLKGARIVFDNTTVGGTENVMMAACLAEGTTIIEGAAREPEVVDLAGALNAMGARIEGAGESTMVIEGVKSLSGLNYRVIPDRIELGTLIVAAAITKGTLTIRGGRPDHAAAIIEKLAEMGVGISEGGDGALQVNGDCDLKPVHIKTVPYPGLPHGHAGPDNGPGLHRAGDLRHHGEHLREPVHARTRAGAHGGRPRRKGQDRDRPRH